jgi:PepSY-associated TM region
VAPVRAWLILVHRYLGIALSLLFLVWFVSGVAMIYARDMPRLTPQSRLAHLPSIDLERVRLSAWQAAMRADHAERPGRITLLSIEGRPAYRFSAPPAATVFADTGDVMSPVGERESVEIAARFIGLAPDRVRYVRRLETADQWTITQRRQLPLHKISVDDSARTELYVSETLGEVIVETTRASRALAWVAAIPHWLYFAPLRLNDGLWRQVILWTSGLGMVSVAIGLVLVFTQYRVAYAGLMRWHYVTGTVFGIFTLTWVFSGLLSMEPWFWASSDRPGPSVGPVLAGGRMDVSAFPAIDAPAWRAALGDRQSKEIEFRWLKSAPWFVVRTTDDMLLVDAAQIEVQQRMFDAPALLQQIAAANPESAIADSSLIERYDAYYYDRDRSAPLPVLRIQFDDPDRTVAYVDPHLLDVVGRFTRRERVQRWLYHGLHSLDFPFWYYSRAWDVGMIVLLTGGSVLSAIGVVIGWRRLRRLAR